MRSLLAFLRRFRISLAVLATLVAIYALCGFFLVPKLARSAVTQQLAQDGRRVSIAHLAFNPFTFEARIEGFALSDADDTPLLAFTALKVNAALLASVWQRGIVLQEVKLAGPYALLVREADGAINLRKLMPPAATPAAAEPAPASAPLPRIRIGVLAVDDGAFDVKDLSRPQPFSTRLSPIRFSLTDFSTALAYDNAYQFSASLASGEQLDWSGAFSVQPLASNGQFALRNLQATTVQAYLQDQLPVQLVSGVGAVEGRYQLTLDPSLALDITLPAVTLQQFSLAERGAALAAPPVALDALKIADVAFSLAQRSINVGSVEIDGARINAQREANGGLSLSRLLPPPAKTAPAPVDPTATAASEAPWQIGIDIIKLADAALVLDDRAVTPATHFALQPINLTVEGYSSAADAKLKLSGDLKLNRSGRLALAGDLQLQPLNTMMNLDMQGFELAPLQPYLTPYTGLKLKSGQLGGKLRLRYAAANKGPARASVSGTLGIANFVSQDAKQQDFLKWRQLNISGIDYQQQPQKLTIDQVLLAAPYARVVIEQDRSLNLAQVLAAPSAATATPPLAVGAPVAAKPTTPVTAAPAMPIRINTISLSDGSANFADHSIQPQFATGIVGLAGKITGLSTAPASRAKLHIEGRIDEYSPVVIEGEINPLAANQYADVGLNFNNIDLTIFNPYSGRFAGYNVAKGKLSTQLAYKIEARKLDATHHVIVDQLEFGEATGSKEAVPLPIRFVVSLLKDRNGVIELNLPVSGSLDDPQFRIGPLIWKVLLNLLGKAADAPFALIGALFGGGPELSYVDFAAGSAALDAEAQAKLMKLSMALAARPQLRLDVPLVLAENLDRGATAQAALAQRLAAVPATTDRMKALEQLYREQFQKAPDYPPAAGPAEETALARRAYLETALLLRLTPDATALEQLSKDRARAVQSALLANPGIDPERIFITTGHDAAPVEQNSVRMALKLK